MTKPVHPTFWPALLEARDEAPGARTFRFASPKGFRFTPGQFLMFHFADDPKTWRAYSICSSPLTEADYFEVTVGMVGAFSERLGRLKPHAEGGLAVRGPFGRWTYDGSVRHAVLVSGGTGLTPFRSMCLLKIGMHADSRITLCCAAKRPEGLLYRSEYEDWRRRGIDVKEKVTQPGDGTGWDGEIGRWSASSVFAAAADPAAVYYLCGPNKMVQEMREGLERIGVPPQNVRTEKWGDYTDLF